MRSSASLSHWSFFNVFSMQSYRKSFFFYENLKQIIHHRRCMQLHHLPISSLCQRVIMHQNLLVIPCRQNEFSSIQSNNGLSQVLGKSVKPVPVMLLGVLVARKRYSWMKYFYVMLIVLGVVIFMYKKPKESAKTAETSGFIGIGEFLLVSPEIFPSSLIIIRIQFVSLVFDGLTGGIQDKIRDRHQVQAYHMMYAMNIWSCLWASIGIIISGEIYGLYPFLRAYPSVTGNILLLGLTGAIGQVRIELMDFGLIEIVFVQNFIFLTIEWFGPLTCSIFTTTRKFFTILCSILIFGNPISQQQMFGTALVFLGLFLEQFYGKDKHKHK